MYGERSDDENRAGLAGADPAPFVSVIVPHFNDPTGLALCLDDLERQTWPPGRFEIIVADNGSSCGEAALQEGIRGRARLITVRERGAGPARNGGVAAAAGSVLAFTDSDCRPSPGWLAAGVEALSRFDFVGGRVRVLVEDPERMTAAEAFEAVFAFNNEAYVRKKGFTGSGNLFCPKAVFEAVGGFKVGLSEDVEWSHRARAAGYRLGYVAAAEVGHPARRNWPDLRSKARKVNTEGFGLFLARPAGRWLWLGRSLGLPLSAFVHTPKVLRSTALTGYGQRLKAVGMLFRVRAWRFFHALGLVWTADPKAGPGKSDA
jgi:glycosyltransferase involved in cell wall biosynthesis